VPTSQIVSINAPLALPVSDPGDGQRLSPLIKVDFQEASLLQMYPPLHCKSLCPHIQGNDEVEEAEACDQLCEKDLQFHRSRSA
jgi:hypothetical protein